MARGTRPWAGTKNTATGRRRENPPSRRGTVGPTISFLEKEMVPPGGTREKSSGSSSWSSYLKLKCAPTPHSARRKRLHPAKTPRPKRRGLRGNMVPPSNRARPAMRCRTAFPQKCRDCPPGVFSLGPLQRPVLFSAAKPPRPIWAAPQVRRSTQGAPVWGDRSLSNHCMGSSLYARETLAGRFIKPTPRPKRRGLRGNMVPP